MAGPFVTAGQWNHLRRPRGGVAGGSRVLGGRAGCPAGCRGLVARAAGPGPPGGSAAEGGGAAREEVASVWELKPWWCQPWSILTTGVGVVGVAKALAWQLAVLAAPAVGVWWWLFLVLMPRAYLESQAAGEGQAGAGTRDEGGAQGR